MMRSLYSGVAGLKVHQTRMDVIGNNIANVNTTAYKSQSVTFSELMYQTTSNASGPNATTGTAGVNAKQIGLGVSTGAISTAITQAGSAQTTGNAFDIRIKGDNFFVVNDGSTNFFTRDGSFYVDAAGNLAMQSNGYNVMGWGVDPETGKIKQGNVTALRIMSEENMTYEPEATSASYIAGIVDKNDTNINSTSGRLINLTFYDNLGYSYTAKMSMHATSDEGQFYLQLDDVLDEQGESITDTMNAASLSDIVKLGSTQDVNVKESYNPSSETLAVTTEETVDGKPTMVTKKYSIATNYSAETSEYSVKVTDSDGKPVTDLSVLKDVLGGTPESLTGPSAEGIYTIKKDAAEALKSTTPNQLATLKMLFGTTNATPELTKYEIGDSGSLDVSIKTITGGLIKYNTDTGAFISANGNPTGLTFDFNDSYKKVGQTANTSLGNFKDITVDMTTTQNANNGGSSTLAADTGGVGELVGVGTGRKLGNMTGISVSQNGEIHASYDNGQSRLLGQIASAQFTNASGLEKVGDNLYQQTLNSGSFDGIGVDITVGGGSMNTGQLEMSNVDLANEFTSMITTQRGFQANSRIITTSDSMLEELVNLKR
ncbi:MAG: flagellar hook-basal body complex protein [Lachnospiraceae bacterium]|nr:flagellar hook-basal body complex protein [Candidatus Merdinaster equi]